LIGETGGFRGFEFGAGQRRQQHGRQNGDDGDDDEQFNEGEGAAVERMPGNGL